MTDTTSNADGASATSAASQGENINIEEVMSKPIPGPSPAGPEYLFEPDYERPRSYTLIFARFMAELARDPAKWIRANVVEPNRGPKYYWYHRKFPRALPIDECYMDDEVCIFEADLEYRRTHKVDRATLELLRFRRDNCWFWHQTNIGKMYPADECKDIADTYDREVVNFHMKYGDMHHHTSVMHAYNKQKHRMIVERRRAQMAQNS